MLKFNIFVSGPRAAHSFVTSFSTREAAEGFTARANEKNERFGYQYYVETA